MQELAGIRAGRIYGFGGILGRQIVDFLGDWGYFIGWKN
jgi:hypothetical protein